MTDQNTSILWLDEITLAHNEAVGVKAANLATMRRAGLLVAPGFCVSADAYRDFVRANELERDIAALLDVAQSSNDQELESATDRLRQRFVEGAMAEAVTRQIVEAYHQLVAQALFGPQVAVRSSATLEDLPVASFAGQGDTYLNVISADEVLARVRGCWASLWTARAVRYRQAQKLDGIPPAMAVLVQAMIPTDVGGVAFSVHPVTGADEIVVEAAPGLAEAVVQGTAEVTRYILPKSNAQHVPSLPETGQNLLTPAQLRQLAEAVLDLEQLFGGPQDVEWGFWRDQIYLLQSRPITTADPTRAAARAFFTRVLPNDDHLWTGGYLNERFPRPVSPLGWSVVGGLTEELALRDPLHYLGYRHTDRLPLTKLHRGHPYANAAAFQMFYKVFPDALMPEDAYRYFLNGDVSLRKEAPYPCCLLDPRFIASMLCHFIREPANWSPLHNYRHWARFVSRHQAAIETIAQLLCAKETRGLGELWDIAEELQRWHRELLGIHRWSLTAADLTLAILRRIVCDGDVLSHLLTGLPNKSIEMDCALYNLRDSAREDDVQSSPWQDFLTRYGHRSFSLDIYYPTFADDPTQVERLLQSLPPTPPDLAARAADCQSTEDEVRAALSARPLGRLRRWVFDYVLALAREYVILREEQRFHWQRALALQRRAFLLIGEKLAREGMLAQADDVFFLTIGEIEKIVHEKRGVGRDGIPSHRIAAARRREFERLQREWELAPRLAYPAFLRGNQPLTEAVADEARWSGRAVSPGMARGPARVVLSPQQFDKIAPGDVLVTRSTDPGWTPLFGRLAGLIMERGGQLSHGAVVAREYGLPAVADIPGITTILRDGDKLLVDGLTGIVTCLDSQESPDQHEMNSVGDLAHRSPNPDIALTDSNEQR